jgi:hypothetical protein
LLVIDLEAIRQRFAAVAPFLDERGRRLVAAAEAKTAGYGGIAAAARATGVAPSTIGRGLAELGRGEDGLPSRVRQPGGGRKASTAKDTTLLADLQALVEPTSRGDPDSPLRWSCKSLRKLSEALRAQGHRASHTLVGELLKGLGFSLQGNRKTKEGGSHPDRDAQFAYINAQVSAALADDQPAISVDTKKKELVGDFKNGGREYRRHGDPEAVRVHDFLIKQLGRAVPYGVYDIAANTGWVSVGIDHDTAAFAVNSIRRWWQTLGRALSERHQAADHRRRRRQQRLARPVVEARAAEPRRRSRPRYRGPSPAARNQQVEQDRAPSLLLHQPELARQAARQLPRHRRADRRDHHQNRPRRALRARHRALSQGRDRLQCRDGRYQHHARQISRRLELHHLTRPLTKARVCCLTGP